MPSFSYTVPGKRTLTAKHSADLPPCDQSKKAGCQARRPFGPTNLGSGFPAWAFSRRAANPALSSPQDIFENNSLFYLLFLSFLFLSFPSLLSSTLDKALT
jgi:hypothetical protein